MKTKVINTENGEFINDFATLELANDFIASKKLEDADLELIAVPVMYVIADGSGDFPKWYDENETIFGGDISNATTFATEQLAKDFIVANDWSELAYVEEN
jgi:hypothetical protein